MFVTDASQALIKDLDALIHTHREHAVVVSDWDGEREELLANLEWSFPYPKAEHAVEKELANLPLREVWQAWWLERPAHTRDDDGLELYRALVGFHTMSFGFLQLKAWQRKIQKSLTFEAHKQKLRYESIGQSVLTWLFFEHLNGDALDFLLDGVETTFAMIPKDVYSNRPRTMNNDLDIFSMSAFEDWRTLSEVLPWLELTHSSYEYRPDVWTDAHTGRYWGLLRWMDEGLPNASRFRSQLGELLWAWQVGAARDADVFDHLIGARSDMAFDPFGNGDFSDLGILTRRKPRDEFETYPKLADIVHQCRERVLSIELKRGDLPTPVSKAAMALQAVFGVIYPLQMLKSLGSQSLIRSYSYDNESKQAVFSRLIRASFPSDEDTLESFKQQAMDLNIKEQRLLDLAVYAPQWAGFVEYALAWTGLEDAIFWLHAHTKDTQWTVDDDIREVWEAQVTERTPLTGAELLDGAVDVVWFTRIHKSLGEDRWLRLDKSAKYASGGGGHKRAQSFAAALLGRSSVDEISKRIADKRHQDSVRALGLIPLPNAKKQRQADLLERYKCIQDFLQSSKQFGSQRQASEKLAARISMDNLARNAGYSDPQRLMWAMETEEIADLAKAAIRVREGETTVTLSIDDKGLPQLEVQKKGKMLKSVPASLRKHPEIARLRERKTEIGKQMSRMRDSLESAMIRGDMFSSSELKDLFKHPVLKPMLQNLVLITEDGALGYPRDDGKTLLRHDGSETKLGKTHIRLAHAHDFLTLGKWHEWQHDCFVNKRQQPFKQVFRELYMLTEAEKLQDKRSSRYEGHQVNPRQAMALLGKRGWVSVPEEGVRRTFHDEGLSAWLEFQDSYYTPAEVDGLTLAHVIFTKRGGWESLGLESIPPRLFSEVMRDLDLVVSVAHRGGVDPEVSASTIEMRASLLHETLNLLELDNVHLENHHALIAGELGSYSIHLGSATVHRQPGGALCIIPVPSQHRGRLFLPFADDDPKTAEVMSKVLMLAKDKEIKDPTILEQLR